MARSHSGAGAGAEIAVDGASYTIWYNNLSSNHGVIKNLSFRDASIYGSYVIFNNCNIYRTRLTNLNSCLTRINHATVTNCYFNATFSAATFIHSDNQFIYIKDSKFTGNYTTVVAGGGPSIFENCTFEANRPIHYMYYGQRFVFVNNQNISGAIPAEYVAANPGGCCILKAYNRVTSIIGAYNDTVNITGTTVCLVSGSTLSLQGNPNQHAVKVAKIIVAQLVNDTGTTLPDIGATSGTATVITASGNTITVSGEGTYLDNDGTTDLTIT